MGRFSVCSFVRPSIHSPLWAIQPGLRPSQPGLRPSQPCLKPEAWLAGWLGLISGWLGLSYGSLAGWASGPAGWPRGGDGWMNKQTDEQKISPFYRTLSPIGAAALPFPMKIKEKVEQGKGTADHLMPLGYLFITLTIKFLNPMNSPAFKREYPSSGLRKQLTSHSRVP